MNAEDTTANGVRGMIYHLMLDSLQSHKQREKKIIPKTSNFKCSLTTTDPLLNTVVGANQIYQTALKHSDDTTWQYPDVVNAIFEGKKYMVVNNNFLSCCK